MKVSVNYILSANKQKKYIQLTKFYGYKYVNGVRKQDKSRENLGGFGLLLKTLNKETLTNNAELMSQLNL